jgi:hypothetical protein
MSHQTLPNLTLFDLLGRNWQLPSPITGLRFNGDGTILAIICLEGAMALARTADSEPPESRLRVSIDVGQATIHPRRDKPAPLITTAGAPHGAAALASYMGSDFLLGTEEGDVIRLTNAGAIAETIMKTTNPVVSVDHCMRTGMTAAVDRDHMYLKRIGADALKHRNVENTRLEIVSLSNEGNWIALAAADRLSISRLDDPVTSRRDIFLPSVPASVQWSDDDSWLACGLQSGGFCLVDVAEDRSSIVTDFPGPVATVAWSTSAHALVASGAFRIAAWSMASPPLNGNTAGALATGRAGFVVVEAVAAHPTNNLVAAGYANGQIVVSRIGAPDQLLVRSSGAAVTALTWSADGKHLAAGDANGNAAIVTFPVQLFK